MAEVGSPYRPGFGAMPAVFVGREAQLARAEATLARVANAGRAAAATVVFTGARGLGKTVTLGVIADAAIRRGFLTAAVSLDRVSDNVQMLAAAIAEATAPAGRAGPGGVWERMKGRLASLSVEVNAGVVKIVSPPPAGGPRPGTAGRRLALAALLVDAARAALDHSHAGLVVCLDELQEAPTDDLVVLANAIQDATRAERAPLGLFAAGLPHTPELVMAAASFTERFDFRTLDRLDALAAERALLEPALGLGVRWDRAAADLALTAAAGSPYLIQYIGDEAWANAQPGPGSAIPPDAVHDALAQIRDNLGAGMFRGRWAKATPAEKAVIAAIAAALGPDGTAPTAVISAELGATTRQWSMARQSLIDKGIAEPAGHGRLRFTMPGFAEFVTTRTRPNDTPGTAQAALLPAHPALLADPHWPTLADQLDRYARAGHDVAELTGRAIAQGELDPAHPARDLDLRLAALCYLPPDPVSLPPAPTAPLPQPAPPIAPPRHRHTHPR